MKIIVALGGGLGPVVMDMAATNNNKSICVLSTKRGIYLTKFRQKELYANVF